MSTRTLTTASGHRLTFRKRTLVSIRHPNHERGGCAAVNPRMVLRLNPPTPRVEQGYPEVIGRLRGGEIRYQRTADTSRQPGAYYHTIESDGLDVAVPHGATLRTKAGEFRLGKGSVLLTDRIEQANPRRRRLRALAYRLARREAPPGLFECIAGACPSKGIGPHFHKLTDYARRNRMR